MKTRLEMTTKSIASRAVIGAAGQLAHRGARIQRIVACVDEPVESHRRAAGGNHRDDDPADQAVPAAKSVRRARPLVASPAARRPARTAAQTPNG